MESYSLRPNAALLPLSALLTLFAIASSTVGLAQDNSGDEGGFLKAVESLTEAQKLFDAQKFKEAIPKAEEAASFAPKSPGILQRSAEILYRAGASKKSVPLFDKVVEMAPESAARNWQRGIALSSIGDFKRGAAQFKIHHDVNPDDVENSAWYFLCVAKSQSLEAAKKTVIPSRGDGREPMMSILQMLKGEIEPEEVMEAALKNTSGGASRKRAQFYADLYIGLYYDSLNKSKLAEKYLKQSLSYDDTGYMVDVARVYLQDRFSKSDDKTKQ